MCIRTRKHSRKGHLRADSACNFHWNDSPKSVVTQFLANSATCRGVNRLTYSNLGINAVTIAAGNGRVTTLLFLIRFCFALKVLYKNWRLWTTTGRTSWLKEMSLPTSFHASVFFWLQSHPIATAFCVLIILYKIYTWLFPDPIMKLPVAPGGSLFGGHTLMIIEWVTQLFSSQMTCCPYRWFQRSSHTPPSRELRQKAG